MQPQKFITAIAILPAGMIVDGEEVAHQVQDKDGIGDVVDNGAIAQLALAQGGLGGKDLGGAFRDPALQGVVEGAQLILQLPPGGDLRLQLCGPGLDACL